MKKAYLVLTLMTALASTACGMTQVDEGYRGLETHFGKLVGEPLTPGLYFYNPITSSIFEMSVKEEKYEGLEECFTRDTQKVTIKLTVMAYPKPDQIGHFYSQFGREWKAQVIPPVILSSLKDTIGQYIADDLVFKREEANNAAFAKLKAQLNERGVVVTRMDFTNLDFDDAYEKAVEAKVVAIQKAAEAKNRTVEVEEQAKQVVKTAEADARAMQIKSQALQQNKGLVEYEAVKKWNGELPQYMFGGTIPILNLDKLTAKK